jgi:uncharacterized membrane protein
VDRDSHMLACFPCAGQAIAAAWNLEGRAAVLLDAYAPFPIPALQRACSGFDKRIPVLAWTSGIVAAIAVFLLQYFSAVDYPYVVGGKPLFSWPAFLPVTVAVAMLMAVVVTFTTLMWMCRLPQLHHALFASRLYQDCDGDGIFLHICCDDVNPLIEWLRKEYPTSKIEVLACD